jgi:hypothetical protein
MPDLDELEALAKRLRYHVGNPSAWDAYSDEGSNLVSEAALGIGALIARVRAAEAGWQPIETAPDGDVLVLNVWTGERAISSRDDKDWRRGFMHRNGFPATHWAPLLKALPTPPEPLT